MSITRLHTIVRCVESYGTFSLINGVSDLRRILTILSGTSTPRRCSRSLQQPELPLQRLR